MVTVGFPVPIGYIERRSKVEAVKSISLLVLLIWALSKNSMLWFSINIRLGKAASCLGSPWLLVRPADYQLRCSHPASSGKCDRVRRLWGRGERERERERERELMLANWNIYVRGRECFEFHGIFWPIGFVNWCLVRARNGAVGIALLATSLTVRGSNYGRDEIFRSRLDGLWGWPASRTVGNVLFPGVKRPGRGINLPHLTPRFKKE